MANDMRTMRDPAPPAAVQEAMDQLVKEEQEITKAVDHPDHYGGGDDPYEVIKVLEAWLPRIAKSLDAGDLFSFGNAIKYLGRVGLKGEDPIKDIDKAIWYLKRVTDRLRERRAEQKLKEATEQHGG